MPIRVQSIRSSTKNTRPTAGTREPGEIYTNFPDLQIGVINAGKVAQDLVAVRFFSATTNYAAGDFVHNAGHVYRAKNPIVAGPFNAADWDTAPTSGEFEPPIAAGTTADYWRGDKSWQTLNKSAVGLGAVDNTSDANKPVSAATQTALDLKANLASPTFTGDPKAPTPAPGDNDTSIATTAYTTAAIAVSDAAQLAALNLKANIASPTFTGDPRAPTPTAGDNDTSIATTQFVVSAIGTATAPMLPDAPADGFVYGRKNNLWATVIGGAHTDDSPPAGPLQDGQLWYRSSDGAMFIWYVDADSGQWVQVNGPVTAAGTAEARNRIVNPAMQISQENARTASNAINYYPADQWRTVGSGPVFSSASVASPTPGIDPYHSYLNCTTAKPSLAAGDYYIATQTIEGIRLADFGWGTANAKPIVVRLVLMTNFTGTYCLSIRTAASDRSYVVPFTVDGTYSEKVVAIPGDTGGTWPTDTSAGLLFSICACAGPTYQTATPNVWQSGNFLATTTQTNLATATSQLIRYSHVGLYLDPNATGVPPPWQMPDEAQELMACQRYYERSSMVVTTTSLYKDRLWAVPKRVGPALSQSFDAGASATFAIGSSNNNGLILFYQSANHNAIAQALVTGNARM